MRMRQLLATAAVVALAVGGAVVFAAEVTSVSVTPNSLTIVQGGSGGFVASVDSLSGSVPARTPNSPEIAYCREWTIHDDGSVTCDGSDVIALSRGRNYTLSPVTEADGYARGVVVNVDAGAPCNQVYNLAEVFAANAGSGVDFGGGVLVASRTVAVTVTCATPLAFDGCSHGYWKNHAAQWPAGYSEATKLGDVFDLGPFGTLANTTFKDALKFDGGPASVDKAKILLRNAVAGVLNAATPGINYFTSASGLVDLVNDALATGNPTVMLALEAQLDAANGGSPFCND